MKSILKQSLKLFTLCMAVAVIFALSQSAAQAQELTVDGSTNGSTFDPGGNSNGGLSFRGTNFGGTTTGGILDLKNMGTLTINPSTVDTSTGFFTLEVAFTLPNGVTLNPVTVLGQVFGVYNDEQNFALIDFDNNPSVVTFSGANGSGAFSLALDDVCLGDPCALFDERGGDFFGKLRRLKLLNALAFNTAKRGDGNVKFLKAKGASSMFAPNSSSMSAPKQTFTITATITILAECPFCDPPIPPFDPTPQLGPPPTNKDQCKNDGWRAFNNPSFRNQGDCVSFVNHQNRK